MSPPINVEFWTTFYETSEDDDQLYHDVLASSSDPIERAEKLWDWKDLSRGVDFDSVRSSLETVSLETYLERDSAEAVETLGRDLVDSGALANPTVVTPAFVLHLADSDPDEYSARFPIFDASVWTAYVFISGRRTGSDQLPVGATTSTSKYGEFVDFFARTLPDDIPGRAYERALFRFGSYISGVPQTTVGDIWEHITVLEEAVEGYAATANGYLVSG